MVGKRRDASGIILSDFYVLASSHQWQLFRREPYVDEEQWCTIWFPRRQQLLSYVPVPRMHIFDGRLTDAGADGIADAVPDAITDAVPDAIADAVPYCDMCFWLEPC
jgi:hypothetical protein